MQDLLPKKADLIEHEKAVLELKDHFRRIVELGARLPHQHHVWCGVEFAESFPVVQFVKLAGSEGKGLPPELLEALRMLKGMEGLKDLVKAAGEFPFALQTSRFHCMT